MLRNVYIILQSAMLRIEHIGEQEPDSVHRARHRANRIRRNHTQRRPKEFAPRETCVPDDGDARRPSLLAEIPIVCTAEVPVLMPAE